MSELIWKRAADNSPELDHPVLCYDKEQDWLFMGRLELHQEIKLSDDRTIPGGPCWVHDSEDNQDANVDYWAEISKPDVSAVQRDSMSKSLGVLVGMESEIAAIREWTGKLLAHQSDAQIYEGWCDFSASLQAHWLEIDSNVHDFVGWLFSSRKRTA